MSDDIDIQDLEEQDWTLGGDDHQEVIEFGGMEFLVQDPDDDDVLNMMAGGGGDEPSQRMFELVQSATVAPEMTLERWQDMRTSERIGLAMRISQAIGLNDMMDFPERGPDLPTES
ncbi:hypothetical protein [Halobacterium salinarum]|uniref:hypothetical protein n=1 Tax=Halobacterium salinarum TaxID=2242 RepID=UPI0025533BA5|nr:hypothetical protein [Halobacterium salinarum]MDL0133524.1 hypothetical protein [Halobacterium salinarum]